MSEGKLDFQLIIRVLYVLFIITKDLLGENGAVDGSAADNWLDFFLQLARQLVSILRVRFHEAFINYGGQSFLIGFG